jgi:hypothetical protein
MKVPTLSTHRSAAFGLVAALGGLIAASAPAAGAPFLFAGDYGLFNQENSRVLRFRDNGSGYTSIPSTPVSYPTANQVLGLASANGTVYAANYLGTNPSWPTGQFGSVVAILNAGGTTPSVSTLTINIPAGGDALKNPLGIAASSAFSDILIVDSPDSGARVIGYNPVSGSVTGVTGVASGTQGIALNPDGSTVYTATNGNYNGNTDSALRVFSYAGGTLTPVGSSVNLPGGYGAAGLAFYGGYLYVSNYATTGAAPAVIRYQDTGSALALDNSWSLTDPAFFAGAAGIAFDNSGDLYVANFVGGDIRRYTVGSTAGSFVASYGSGFGATYSGLAFVDAVPVPEPAGVFGLVVLTAGAWAVVRRRAARPSAA